LSRVVASRFASLAEERTHPEIAPHVRGHEVGEKSKVSGEQHAIRGRIFIVILLIV
jgi:hypothetical protein